MDTGLTIAACMVVARQVTVEQAEDYARIAGRHADRTHALGPILDPTGYRREGPQADGLVAVAQAFAALRRAIEDASGLADSGRLR